MWIGIKIFKALENNLASVTKNRMEKELIFNNLYGNQSQNIYFIDFIGDYICVSGTMFIFINFINFVSVCRK